MTIPTTPSFSRSGRSGPGGKHTERISTDVSESLLCDIADAQELFRERSPTATRAEVVRMNDMHGADFAGIEEIKLVEPSDWVSRQANLRRSGGLEERIRDRAQSLELELRAEDEARRKAKRAIKSPRVPRNTEPCNLVSFLGIVAGGTAAALVALALAGWGVGSLVDLGLQWAGVR